MNACPDFERLVAHACGDATAEESAVIEAHLATCVSCRVALEDVRADDELAQRVVRVFAAKSSAPATRFPGIPGYTIDAELGRGGMGVVYAATQVTSGRRVALKVVRGASWVGETTLKLFQREIQVLARLQHKGIAALYDAGATDDGEHFFAMELVVGRTLVRDVEARSLPRRELLELFARVCDAIQHAHQRGIVHRDLKPSNILVDADGEPRVLDFGLAKITEADVGLSSFESVAGSIRGTLAYMSPEQARGDASAIDSRSDVYALGVVLYELLTRALPNDVSRTSLHEAVRVICEVAPARPSLVDASLRGDLETILLKALEKEPERRYATAAALADDVRRFLCDEVILARPPSSAYQLQKLVARHQLPFALAGAVFVIAIGSAIALGVLYANAERARNAAEVARVAEMNQREIADAARAEEVRQRQAAETARAEETHQREIAITRQHESENQALRKQSTLDFFVEMIGKARHEALGPDVRVVDVVEAAGNELEARTDLAPGVAAAIGLNIAGVENSLGNHERAEKRLRWTIAKRAEEARDVEDEDVFLEIQLTNVLNIRGQTAESDAALARAENLMSRAQNVSPRTRVEVSELSAKRLKAHGDFAGAEKLMREVFAALEKLQGPDHIETLNALTDLAILVAEQGRAGEAQPLTEELVLRQMRAHGPEHPNTLNAQVTLAMLYIDLERFEEARALLEATLAKQERVLGPSHVQVLLSTNNLAGAYTKLGNKERAFEIWQSLLPKQEAVLGLDSMPVLNTRKNIGSTLYDLKRFEESRAFLVDLVARCDAHLPPGHYLRALSLTALGKAQITLKRYDEAETSLLASVAQLRTMRGANPAWTRAAATLLVALYERWEKPAKADDFRELAKTGVAH